jgi:hypothetical protein
MAEEGKVTSMTMLGHTVADLVYVEATVVIEIGIEVENGFENGELGRDTETRNLTTQTWNSIPMDLRSDMNGAAAGRVQAAIGGILDVEDRGDLEREIEGVTTIEVRGRGAMAWILKGNGEVQVAATLMTNRMNQAAAGDHGRALRGEE